MSKEFTRRNYRHETVPAAEPKHRAIAPVELLTTAALALSTAVAVTAVSIGMARADVIGSVGNGDSAPLAIAAFIGLLFSGMGGLTALMARRG
jgi:hypothetical protein